MKYCGRERTGRTVDLVLVLRTRVPDAEEGKQAELRSLRQDGGHTRQQRLRADDGGERRDRQDALELRGSCRQSAPAESQTNAV